jgi:hypothetical protein
MSSVWLMIPIVVTAPVVFDRSSTHGLQMLGSGAAVGVASAARQCRADKGGGKENVHRLILAVYASAMSRSGQSMGSS